MKTSQKCAHLGTQWMHETFINDVETQSMKVKNGFPGTHGRYVRIVVQSWQGHITLRAAVIIKDSTGIKQLVNPEYGKCSRSSAYGNEPSGSYHAKGRLDSSNAWCAGHNRPGEWWQMDLGGVKEVVGVVTQGRKGHGHSPQWVKSFKVQVSNDGGTWTYVEHGKVFDSTPVNRCHHSWGCSPLQCGCRKYETCCTNCPDGSGMLVTSPKYGPRCKTDPYRCLDIGNCKVFDKTRNLDNWENCADLCRDRKAAYQIAIGKSAGKSGVVCTRVCQVTSEVIVRSLQKDARFAKTDWGVSHAHCNIEKKVECVPSGTYNEHACKQCTQNCQAVCSKQKCTTSKEVKCAAITPPSGHSRFNAGGKPIQHYSKEQKEICKTEPDACMFVALMK